jgi:hypothetical protein
MRWLAGIPVAAAGIDRSAPDDVPGLEDSRDTDATLANDANDTPLADTPDYSNELGEKPAETTARTLLKGTNASHADGDSPAHSLDRSRCHPQTDGGPSEPDTLMDYASGRSVNFFLRRFLRSLSTHTQANATRRSSSLTQTKTAHPHCTANNENNPSRTGNHQSAKLVSLQTAADKCNSDLGNAILR